MKIDYRNFSLGKVLQKYKDFPKMKETDFWEFFELEGWV